MAKNIPHPQLAIEELTSALGFTDEQKSRISSVKLHLSAGKIPTLIVRYVFLDDQLQALVKSISKYNVVLKE